MSNWNTCLAILSLLYLSLYPPICLSQEEGVEQHDFIIDVADKLEYLEALVTLDSMRIEANKLLSIVIENFFECDEQTNEYQIAAYLDVLRVIGKDSKRAREAIVSKLPENNLIFKDRGPKEVMRLRGYALVTLAELGPTDNVLPIIIGELAHGHEPYMVSAAARVAGALGPKAKVTVPFLLQFLGLGQSFHDDHLSFRIYNPTWPLEKPTTTRLEIVRALERIGPGASQALPVLKGIAYAQGRGSIFYNKRELRKAAAQAIKAIETQVPICCRKHAELKLTDVSELALADQWVEPSDRSDSKVTNIRMMDHNGNEIYFSDLYGQPIALTFFYTRCENPNTCSMTVSRFADLQMSIRKAGLGNRVRLAAITFEPTYDTALRLKSFGKNRGMDLSQQAVMLRALGKDHDRLLQKLEVAVNYGGGRVSVHGVQLYLFDKKGRYVRKYNNLIWDEKTVINDLKKLAKE